MWHRDPRTEQLLRQQGINFDYKPGIPVSRLKVEDSLRNNARKDALDPLRVERYSSDMRRGTSFPAIVVAPSGSGFIILAGNQRTNAAIAADRTTVDAYVVHGYSQEQYDNFIRLDNVGHGKGYTEEEIINTCVELSRRHSRPLRHYNDLYLGGNSASYNKLVARNQIVTVQSRLGSKGVAFNKLSDAHLERMHPVPDDNILRDMAIMAIDYKLSTTNVADIVSEIGRKKSEAERKQVVVDAKAEFDAKSKGEAPKPRPAGAAFLRQIASFKKFLSTGNDGKSFVAIGTFLDAAEYVAAKKDIEETVNMLKRLK